MNTHNKKLELLQLLISDRFNTYIDGCDFDEDRGITAHYFGDWCSDNIELEYGKEHFEDFNIVLMAADYAENFAQEDGHYYQGDEDDDK